MVRMVQSADGNTSGVLKILKNPRDSVRRYRLAREVQALEKLRDTEGIPRILDHNTTSLGEKEIPLYLVIERIEGVTLSKEFRTPLNLDESLKLTIKICELVFRCHRCNVTHRDIKPDNIIIERITGNVSLIDFGEAWNEDQIPSLETDINAELGNRFLRLPEFTSGTETKDDPRSDLTFVVGILFWLLTQKKPAQLLNAEPNPPHRRMESLLPEKIVSDTRWPFVRSIFDVGFSPGAAPKVSISR